jgi:hypothetical protein
MSNSATDATRGAGFAAGRTAAAAARLITDVARASGGSWAGAAGVAAQTTALAERCEHLAEADATAFAEALAALGTASPDLAVRLERAAAVPLEIAQAAADVAEAGALAAERCDGLVPSRRVRRWPPPTSSGPTSRSGPRTPASSRRSARPRMRAGPPPGRSTPGPDVFSSGR